MHYLDRFKGVAGSASGRDLPTDPQGGDVKYAGGVALAGQGAQATSASNVVSNQQRKALAGAASAGTNLEQAM